MTFKFLSQPLLSGLYEPEGIYLHAPLARRGRVVQRWGDHPDFYAQFKYSGVTVKGHIGLDLETPLGTPVLAMDAGRVVELSYEVQGFGRYLKLEHVWGESLYAHLSETTVDAGQTLTRGALIAYSGDNDGAFVPHLHIGIRIKPYNRFDGWGGFSDPLPYLSASDLEFAEDSPADEPPPFAPPPLAIERPALRRP